MRFLRLALAFLTASNVLASCGSASCAVAGACPTDAPTATKFGQGAYAWADSMVDWTCVYNIKDFDGSPDAAFAAAQAAAVAGGGGVVFFPAGSYDFASNISLASNVVIRGVPDIRPAIVFNMPGTLAPTSVFNCPNRAHQGIWNFDPAATNLGVVNIFLDQCAVMLWPGLKTSSYEPMMSSWWFSATDIAGMGSNKLVLSNVVRDVSLGRSLLGPKHNNTYPYIFSIAVGVYTDRNALVANNLLPPSARNEQTTITLDTSGQITVPYMYDNRYGIDVNSILLGAVAGAYAKGPGSKCGTPSAFAGLYPACAPWNFRSGITIRDNYVAQNGRVGISWTGGADTSMCLPGKGTQVLNNRVEVKGGTTCYTLNGDKDVGGADTNENRGYMNSGYCSNITNNSGRVNRQKAGSTPYETVDGEGILHQSENGNNAFGDVYVANDLSGGSSGYIGIWDLPLVNYTSFYRNTVNADQLIGVISIQNGDQIGAEVHCSGNYPPAVLGKNPCPQ